MATQPEGVSDLPVLEQDVRLSQSLLWRLQEEYFTARGIDAWQEVPFYATSNAYACDTYAEMVLAFLLDCAPQLDRRAPVWLLELGAGTGCFSYRFVQALLRKRATFSALADLDIRYVMTDFAPGIVDSWRANPSLKPLMEAGRLDCAVFRPEEQSAIQLQIAQRTLSATDFQNPAIVFANYVFDTLRHDAFRVDHGKLYEARFKFLRDSRVFPPDTPVSLDQLKAEESYVLLTSENYYDEPSWNQLLQRYRQELEDGSVLIPLGGLKTVRQLRQLTHDNLALFVMDKGFTDVSMMRGLWPQEYACHGSISFMVNFDAIRHYTESAGGRFLQDHGNGGYLSVAMNAFLPRFPAFEHTRHFFAETLQTKDPFNSLCHIQTFLEAAPAQPTDPKWSKTFLSIIQTCSYDPVVFAAAAPQLEHAFDTMDDRQRAALRNCLDRVRDNIYSLDRRPEMLGGLLKLYYRLGCFNECLDICGEYSAAFGEMPWVLGYLAASHEMLGRLDLALRYLKQYRALEPENGWVNETLNRVRYRLLTEAVSARRVV